MLIPQNVQVVATLHTTHAPVAKSQKRGNDGDSDETLADATWGWGLSPCYPGYYELYVEY